MTDVRRIAADQDAVVMAAAELFDHPPQADVTRQFLSRGGHHLLMAFDGDRAVGFVTGVETTHPDKGTEMFLYELGVVEEARNRGVGRSLVAALAEVARERGCYGMWVLTDDDNPAAVKAYEAAGGRQEQLNRLISWDWRSR